MVAQRLGAHEQAEVPAARHTAYHVLRRRPRVVRDREDLLGRARSICPTMLDYKVAALDVYTPLDMRAPGATLGVLRAINSSGQAVGRIDDALVNGAVWDTPASPVKLDAGLPRAINSAGTLIVGGRPNGQPVFWTRTATGAWNTVGIVLPSLGGTCGGEAINLNDDGVVVGRSCDARGNINAAIWRIDLSVTPAVVSGPQRLPGLGIKRGSETSTAVYVSPVAPYTVVGGASAQTGGQAVRWTW